MATTIEMPKLSDTMSEGKILSWKKREGDPVSAGEVLAEIESDKANMEMEAYDTGYLRKLLVPEGGSAPVGAPIAVVTEDPAEDIRALLDQLSAVKPVTPGKARETGLGTIAAPPPRPAQTPGPLSIAAAPVAAAPQMQAAGQTKVKVIASPLALRMAAELGLDLRSIQGTGPEGRIVKRDIENAPRGGVRPAAGPTAVPVAAGEHPLVPAPAPLPPGTREAWGLVRVEVPQGAAYEDVPVSTMRKVIAERLSASKVAAPHFYVTVEIDMKAAVAAREHLNKLTGLNITFNDMVVKAVAVALTRHPAANASWQGDFVRYHRSADIAVAVSIPDGLITPVVRGCHLKGLAQISEEVKGLAERARQKKLNPEEYRGSTFTISNLGMLGVQEFTGIINPSEACLLAVGAVRNVPVVEGGAVLPGIRMAVTLSCDHRVIDGAQAALFLRDFKEILENPVSLAL